MHLFHGYEISGRSGGLKGQSSRRESLQGGAHSGTHGGTGSSRELWQPWQVRGLGRPWWILELGRPWRNRELGQPWRIRGLGAPWRDRLRSILESTPYWSHTTPPQKKSLGKVGARSGSRTWRRSVGAALEGALEARALEGARESQGNTGLKNWEEIR